MATVVDSLIVLLNLDPTKFNEGQKKALDQLRKTKENASSTAKDLEASGAQAAAFFDKIASSALKLGAIFLGGIGIKDFVKDTVSSGAAMGRLAYATGTSTEELSTWVQAAKQVGGTGDATAQSLFGLSQSIQEFSLTGQSNIIPFFRAMHVSLTGANGQVKSLTQLLLDLADYADKAGPQNRSRTEFLLRGIGLDQDTINLIIKGRSAVQDYLNTAKQVQTVNEQQSQSLQALQRSITNFGSALETVGRNILVSQAGWLTRFFDFLTNSTIYGDLIDRLLGRSQAGTLIPIPPAVPGAGGTAKSGTLSFFGLTQYNENTPDGRPSPAGAVGRNQILPDTARRYGFDPNRLNEPAYNDMVARAIEADLFRQFHGDVEAMTIAYHSGPAAANRWLASGRNDALLGPQTRAYLARERGAAGAGAGSVEINGDIIIQARDTNDPQKLAERFPPALRQAMANENHGLVTQANIGQQ